MRSFKNGIRFKVQHCWSLSWKSPQSWIAVVKKKGKLPSKCFRKLPGNKWPQASNHYVILRNHEFLAATLWHQILFAVPQLSKAQALPQPQRTAQYWREVLQHSPKNTNLHGEIWSVLVSRVSIHIWVGKLAKNFDSGKRKNEVM